MTFGDKLRALRMAKGASQRRLAGLLSMDPAYLSRIEHDVLNHLPSVEMIRRFVKALKLTQDEADDLYVLARHLPPDVEHKLLAKPQLFKRVRRA